MGVLKPLDILVALVSGEKLGSRDNPFEPFRFFTGKDNRKYVTVKDGPRKKTFLIDGLFEGWLRRQYEKWDLRRKYGPVTRKDMGDLLGHCLGIAASNVKEHVYMRTAHEEGKFWIDLKNERGEVVEISRDKIELVTDVEVPFLVTESMQPLPEPDLEVDTGEMMEKLKRYFNAQDDKVFKLLVGFALACFLPRGPYMLLCINGPQDSGKTSVSRLLGSVLDCYDEDEEDKLPDSVEDMDQLAQNRHVLMFGNLTHIPDKMSDALATMVTGYKFSRTRKFTHSLYASKGSRPVIINGIPTLIKREDLASRTVVVELESIEERVDPILLWERWREDHPKVLGLFVLALQAYLRNKDNVKLEGFSKVKGASRMISALTLIESAHTIFGWKSGEFSRVYVENRQKQQGLILEGSPFANALIRMVKNKRGWSGSMDELLKVPEIFSDKPSGVKAAWPKNSIGAGSIVNKFKDALENQGVVYDKVHLKSGQRWHFRYVPENRRESDG